jgi:hypothetical protein
MEVINEFIISMIQLKLWPWFVVGLFLPFTGVIIILFWPLRKKKVRHPLMKPVSSEEIFDPELELQEPRRINRSGIQFSARA